MVKCKICGSNTNTRFEIAERRYYEGLQVICKDCFDHLIVNDFDYLDKKAVNKMRELLKEVKE